MAKDKELVRLVRYVFSAPDLSLNLSDLSRYNIDESVQNYISLCEEELQHTYPQAVIEVIDSDSTTGSTATSVETLTYLEEANNFEETPDLDETEVVEEICRRIFDQRLSDWAILKKFMPIIVAKGHTKLPLSVIRWICANGLSEGASKPTGYWELLYDNVSKIREIVMLVNNQERLENLPNQNLAGACYLEDMKHISIAAIPEDFKLLIASREGFSENLFKPDTSLFLICRMGHQIEIEVEHFVDGVGWSDSPWRYPTYAEALASQAKRKGIDCKTQLAERNGKQEIDGVSLRLSRELTPEVTLQILIDKVLLVLSEVVNDAELSLNGGPIWDDKIYGKKGQELRFHREVLEPLLRKMDYQSVNYTHGNDEYGRDFIFEQTTPFLELRYYGLQAKAGDLSGGANSEIDTILAQIDDAFAMPYTKKAGRSNSEIYIDTLIIAISGKFKRNAVDKIRIKMPQHLIGSVYFWDKEKIISLIAQYWKKEND